MWHFFVIADFTKGSSAQVVMQRWFDMEMTTIRRKGQGACSMVGLLAWDQAVQ
jgi:hypothetical protein